MFITLFCYQIRRLLRSRECLFWILAFPIILGTLFYMAFGSAMEKHEGFEDIPVALITDGERDADLVSVIRSMGKEGDNKLFKVTEVKEDEAKKSLKNDKIIAYIIPSKDAKVVVRESGMKQSIVKEVMDEYKRAKSVVTNVIANDPTYAMDTRRVEKLVETVTSGTEHIKEITLGTGEQDSMLTYFYALISMACIYGSLLGLDIVMKLEGNITPLGARRCVAPMNKLKVLVADFLGAVLIHIAIIGIILAYLIKVLGVNFGTQIPYIMMASALGCVIGISMGIFIGALVKGNENIKSAVAIAISMAFCFFAGLMDANMPHVVEKHCPIFNRINPCALLSNSFYSLNCYKTKTVYWTNMGCMLFISIVLIVGAFVLIRRRKYASIS